VFYRASRREVGCSRLENKEGKEEGKVREREKRKKREGRGRKVGEKRKKVNSPPISEADRRYWLQQMFFSSNPTNEMNICGFKLHGELCARHSRLDIDTNVKIK